MITGIDHAITPSNLEVVPFRLASQTATAMNLTPAERVRVLRVLFVRGSGRQPIQCNKTINDNCYLLTNEPAMLIDLGG